jgi:putative SOS response-associated peptidase YedK
MCFFYALSKTAQSLANRYQLKLDFEFELQPELSQPIYYTSGFDFPRMPVITNENPDRIQGFTWGLVPSWVKSKTQVDEIRSKTLNARNDTVFEKPSFRSSIKHKRCLVPADGFYEWREVGGKKYPYFIYLKDKNIFSFGGIWEDWIDYITGEIVQSFSIITTDANPLMAMIHNTKKRMPLILPMESEKKWLDNNLNNEGLKTLMVPFDENKMEAHTISKLITSRTGNRNVSNIQESFEYPELKAL